MAMRDNWFDREFQPSDTKSVKEILAEIAKNPRVIKAIEDALADRDRHITDAKSKGQTWAGPTRPQTIRQALAEVLQLSD